MSALIASIRKVLSGESPRRRIPPMDGPLSPNSRLDELEPLTSPLAPAAPPDDVASDGRGGLLVSCGAVLVAIDKDGQSRELLRFEAPLSAFAGLGDGTLVVAVDGTGLRHIDVHGASLHEHRIPTGVAHAGVTAITPDGLGGVYFCVGSTRHLAEDWVWDLMECNSDGLLGHWVPGQNPTILRSGLAWPNGVAIAHGGRHLIVTESWTHRITRFAIESDGLKEPEILADNMIGYPSRISVAKDGGYWLAVFARRTQLIEMVLREKAFKRAMMESLEPDLWICPALASSGSHLEPLQMGGIRALGVRKPWAPPRAYGLVIRTNSAGIPIFSMHSRVDGHFHGVTAAREIDNRLIIVSKGARRLLVSPLETHLGATP